MGGHSVGIGMAMSKNRDPGVPVTLRELLRREELTDQQAMELGHALAETLAEAQRRGRFQAQLTDRKVLVLEGGRVQVAGLDRSSSGQRPEQGKPSPMYMAPAQWRGEEPTGAAQVWALGLLLHQMIAGRHPYAELEEGQLAEAVCSDDAVPLDPCFDEVAPRLSELVSGCLHKEADSRPPAQQVARDLGELLDSCQPSDPTAKERARRRRFRRLEQLEQQRTRPRRSALGMLVGGGMVLFLSAIHYRDFLWGPKKWGAKERGAPSADRGTGTKDRKTGTGKQGPENRDRKTGQGEVGGREVEAGVAGPDSGAAPKSPAPAAAGPTAPPTHELYPTSTPEPATVPLPVPPSRR